MKHNAKKERKKPKYIRDAEKARDAEMYSKGFEHGYQMGLSYSEGLKDIKNN